MTVGTTNTCPTGLTWKPILTSYRSWFIKICESSLKDCQIPFVVPSASTIRRKVIDEPSQRVSNGQDRQFQYFDQSNQYKNCSPLSGDFFIHSLNNHPTYVIRKPSSDNLRQPLIHFSNIASIEDLTRQLYNLQSTSCAIIIRVRIGSILTSAPIILSLSLGTVSTVEGRNDQPLKHGCSKDSHRGGGWSCFRWRGQWLREQIQGTPRLRQASLFQASYFGIATYRRCCLTLVEEGWEVFRREQ